jgi:competence protein ComEA
MNQWLDNHRLIVFAAIGVLIAAAAGVFALRWRTPEPIVVEAPPPTSTPGLIKVYVSGAVAHPDVYPLAQGSIVKDALSAAGGAAADADLNHVNLAQALGDGQQIYVPRIGEAPTQGPSLSTGGTAAPTGPININTATQLDFAHSSRITEGICQAGQ